MAEQINEENNYPQQAQIQNSNYLLTNQVDQYACFDIQRVANLEEDKEIFQETTCQVCLNEIANNPVLCHECNKIFGYQCAEKIFDQNDNKKPPCPSCKVTWEQPLEKLKNRFARDMIARNFKIHCKNHINGCKEILKCNQETIITHENNCLFEEVLCISKDQRCGWKGMKTDLQQHQDTECELQIIACKFCKSENEPFYEYFKKEQHEQTCQNMRQQCEFCQQSFTRKNLPVHEHLECPNRKFTCKACQQVFLRDEYLQHEKINCYTPGNEKEMFSKLIDMFQVQKEQHNIELTQQKLINNKLKVKFNLNARLSTVSLDRRQKVLSDFDKGICHINSLEQLQEISENEIEIKSIIINETDLHRYTYSRNSTIDFSNVLNILKKLSHQGDSWSQFSLGLLYYCGDKDIEMNDQLAYEWALKSCESGNPGGQCLLGLHYLFGYYIEKNYQLAIYYFEQSAKQIFPPAFYYLGDCYFHGKGMANSNEDRGLEFYFQSAQLGYPYALKSIAEKYEDGTIYTTNSSEKAYEYYLKAAEKGVLGAMKQVQEYLKMGKGIRKNLIQAEIWLQRIKNFEQQEQNQKKEEQENEDQEQYE